MKTAARRLAAVVAHPDDEVISLGGFLLGAQEEGYDLHILWLTDGSGSSSPHAKERPAEAKAVASALGASVSILGLPDRGVEVAAAIYGLEPLLRALTPEYVVWPFSVERYHNQDHTALHAAMMNISARTSYGESIWIASQPVVQEDPDFVPSLYHGFDEQRMGQILDLMSRYASERNIPFGSKVFSDPATLRSRRTRAASLGGVHTPYAEPFQPIKGQPTTPLFNINVVRFADEDTWLHIEAVLSPSSQGKVLGRLQSILLDGVGAFDPTPSPSPILRQRIECDEGIVLVVATALSESKFEIRRIDLVPTEETYDLTTEPATAIGAIGAV